MQIVMFDGDQRDNLLPLTYTRPVAALRTGILEIHEKWSKIFGASASFLTLKYLQKKFPLTISDDNLFINGGLLPDGRIEKTIGSLKKGEVIIYNDIVIAARVSAEEAEPIISRNSYKGLFRSQIPYEPAIIEQPWHLFKYNGMALEYDFALLTKGRKSQPLSKSNTVIGDRVFVEKGAKVEAAVINSTTGPVYIGKNAEVMEGSIIRGGFALCDNATLKLGAKIYGPTTIGPHSKVGGEVNNSVIQGYSNKAHDGFLGNSVLGEWCNIGADTNTSNLKNNYAEVRLWNYNDNRFIRTGQQFIGLIMGDHSKCGINTMFNTGTVVGVSANVYGAGYPRNFIPSFAWGGAAGFMEYKFEKACEVAEMVMKRRNVKFDKTERKILKSVFDLSDTYRKNIK